MNRHCENCGSSELNEVNGAYECAYCGTKWEKHTADEVMEKLTGLLDEAKQEALANARRNLHAATHEEYLDSYKILSCVQQVQVLYPEDFFAKFYELASGNDARALNAFLDGLDAERYKSYIGGVIDYMLRVMTRENILSVGNLIERAYKGKPLEYSEKQTKFESEAEKVAGELYEVDIPRDVFVAYKSEDMKAVMTLVDYLEENGVSCFVALRNLRHGKNAAGVYEAQIQKAIDSCSIVLFVSSQKSRTTGDARFKELPYVRSQDLARGPAEYASRNDYAGLPRKYKKPRIEYVIEAHTGFANERFVKEFFDGCTWRKTPEEVYNAVYEIQNAPTETPAEPQKPVRPAIDPFRDEPASPPPPQNGLIARAKQLGGTIKTKVQQFSAQCAAAVEDAKRKEEEREEAERRAKEEAARKVREKAARKEREEAERKERAYLAQFEIENGVLKKYKGAGGDVIIPSGVTSIGSKAFADCRSVVRVKISDGVTSIGQLAFYDCKRLKSVFIPESVTSVGEYAFYGCGKLKMILCTAKKDERTWDVKWLGNCKAKVVWEYKGGK